MYRLMMSALALCCALDLAAQEPKPAAAGKQTSPAQQDFDLLVADFAVAQKAANGKRQELMKSDEYKKAAADKDRDAMTEIVGRAKLDAAPFGDKALTLAAKYAGDDALRFYFWTITRSTDKASAEKALAAIVKDHLQQGNLVPLLENGFAIGRAVGNDAGNAFLERVAKSEQPAVARAFALYWQGQGLYRSKNGDEKAKGNELLRHAAQLAENTAHADKIGAPIFEQEKLQIGMTVPDVEGKDTDGTPFKLSDYRGKVVVLDFWGFW